MGPLELAHTYMDCFFGKASLDNMEKILSDELYFEGPLYTFTSAADYLTSLKNNPPEDVSYKIINEYENKTSACLIYHFIKPGINTLMAQCFEVKLECDRISRINLIFDTSKFI